MRGRSGQSVLMRCVRACQARKKELETKAALWDDRGGKLQRELATLREENLRLTHNMQARPDPTLGPAAQGLHFGWYSQQAAA